MDVFGLARSRVRADLLCRFFRTPERTFYVRELERLVGTSAGNVRRELLRLTDAGLLVRRGEGNTVQYGLNTEYPLLEETRAIVERVLGVEYALREALNTVDSVILAYANRRPARCGLEQIDVTVVGNPDPHALMAALKPVEERLHARLTCSIYDQATYQRRMQRAPGCPGPISEDPSRFLLREADGAR